MAFTWLTDGLQIANVTEILIKSPFKNSVSPGLKKFLSITLSINK
jgi:hypothetical protein